MIMIAQIRYTAIAMAKNYLDSCDKMQYYLPLETTTPFHYGMPKKLKDLELM